MKSFLNRINDVYRFAEDMVQVFRHSPKHKININFVYMQDYPIWDAPLEYFADPVIVQYRNGLFEILPKNLRGTSIKDYLGFRSTEIIYWGVLPGLNSLHNPSFDPDKKNVKVNKVEIYDQIHTLPLDKS